ncbi:glycine/D-amino acid oxidase-like deaminating enzyme [Sphingomonas leidyi]|uniref:Glycine/D-amino acid oxidase-like deaminating enzyme n=1 Tax=Sphingomonas leidyi TaxID=68569 RepID=A0A7X5V1J3_9SPHN|nr:FAD-binding oxidoreductase [Sphingomonas leidyi]NIJ66201.1 glycine/D-amino acid oxidase-like deaminating enzyme [Sphingomonas leidyi]
MQHQPISRRKGEAPSTMPLWVATAAPGPGLAPLGAEIEADVLVIGGGIAGMTTALHLVEAGVDTVLLEAGQPGDQATGWSGGLVAPDYIRHTPETIGTVLGRHHGEMLTRMIGGSARAVFDLIERHAIDCDARQDGFYTPAHSEGLAQSQRGYAEQWQSRGYDVRFVEAREARHMFGVERYCGALRFGEGGSLNPLGYVRGLAQAALKQGARLFGESPVQALRREGGRWIARTPGGAVSARRVVLAANGGNARLHPALRRTALPLHVVQFATAPLDDVQRAAILPEGGAFTDKVSYLFTARLDPQGHLISAFPMSFLVRGDRAHLREARRRLRQHFAALSDPRIDHVWEGLAWVNASFLPELYDLGDGALAIQADNGRGIGINTQLGIEVAAAIASNSRARLSVVPREPHPIRLHAGAALLPKLLMTMAWLSN